MTKMEFDNKISLGHVVSFSLMLVTVAAWGIRLEERSASTQKDIDQYKIEAVTTMQRIQNGVDKNESAIRVMERSSASQDAKLGLIIESLGEIKSDLQKLR